MIYPPQQSTSTLKSGTILGNESSSNHPFPGAFAVSFREGSFQGSTSRGLNSDAPPVSGWVHDWGKWQASALGQQKSERFLCVPIVSSYMSGQIIIFHQPRFPWNKGSHFPSLATIWGEVVWGRYNLTRYVTHTIAYQIWEMHINKHVYKQRIYMCCFSVKREQHEQKSCSQVAAQTSPQKYPGGNNKHWEDVA